MIEPPRLIDEATVRRVLGLTTLMPALRSALIELSAGRVIQPLRLAMDVPVAKGFLLVKPALIGDVLATKLIGFSADNAARGLPTLMATLVLMQAHTGRTLALIEATWLTELRTAAVSALAVEAFAPQGELVVAILGSGALARSHALALRAVRPVSELRIWSRHPRNVARCVAEVGGRACGSAEQAVRGADVVVTVTNAIEPVLAGRWLKPGAVVAAVGAPRPDWRELDDAAMAHWLVVDHREAALRESGDVIGSGTCVQAELGEVLGGSRPRPPPGTTVIFKSLGLAVEDAVAARLVYEAVSSENR